MTILPHHAGMIAELDIGEVTVLSASGSEKLFIAGGYVEVDHNKVKVLADIVEKSSEIDLNRAQESRKRATDRLNSLNASTDIERASRAMKRADVRIMVAETMASVARG
jgi:F-type H+-transporting ATPase subunit epsilon